MVGVRQMEMNGGLAQEDGSSLEDALSSLEARIDPVIKSAATLLTRLRGAKRLIAEGVTKDFPRAFQTARDSVRQLETEVDGVTSSWTFDVRGYLATGSYARELLAAAKALDVSIFEQDGRLIAYPHVVEMHPTETTVTVDAARERRLRPSVLAHRLKEAQDRPPATDGRGLLEAIFAAYEHLVPYRDGSPHLGATVALLDVHDLLTLMPDQRKLYKAADFARDVANLDVNGPRVTEGGFRLSLPASTGTKTTRALTTVTPDGTRRVYFGVAFDKTE